MYMHIKLGGCLQFLQKAHFEWYNTHIVLKYLLSKSLRDEVILQQQTEVDHLHLHI